MNCKPGDLAEVVSCGGHPDLSFMLGAIRRVKRCEMAWYGPAWTYEGEHFEARGMIFVLLSDAWLRPIRPDGITDEEVRDLYAPNRDEVTA